MRKLKDRALISGIGEGKVGLRIGRAGEINGNGRVYSRAAYENALKIASEDIKNGKLLGLYNHQADDGAELSDIVLKFEEIGFDGDDIIASATLINNEKGRNLKALFDAGVNLGVSSSGEGSSVFVRAEVYDGEVPKDLAYVEVISDDYKFRTIDIVVNPAFSDGKITKMESLQKGDGEKMEKMEDALKEIGKLKAELEEVKKQNVELKIDSQIDSILAQRPEFKGSKFSESLKAHARQIGDIPKALAYANKSIDDSLELFSRQSAPRAIPAGDNEKIGQSSSRNASITNLINSL